MTKVFFGLFLLVNVLLVKCEEKSSNDYVLCARVNGSIKQIDEDGGTEEISTESPFLKCKNSCFTVWQEDETSSIKEIMGQGCWDSSQNECDRAECLADKKPSKATNNTKFCCCSENMCNVNFTYTYVNVEEPVPPPKPVLNAPFSPPFKWVIVSVVFFLIVVCLLIIIYVCWHLKPKKNDVEAGLQQLNTPTEYNLEKLKLINIIGQGRYGCVWKGLIDDQEVAVKVFPSHHRTYFLNEQEIYKISGENSGIVQCFGGGEQPGPISPNEYLLLLNLEQESLQDYLKSNTLDLATLTKMALGFAKGLAHLHSDLGKPCIAHRDLNTRNILVKSDLSCCICDLGLAVVPRKTENRSLSEAGTLRYMAPEVLEGAVNLRDCESALKQIDVYALGLVLWEVGVRCSDMQMAEPAGYATPFAKEVGDNPSLEQMQTLVSRRKARPFWPASWKDSAAARLLAETAEDCWDQDAEARLTSLCVVERLLELPTRRILHQMTSSPTPLINNNHLHDHPMFDNSVGTVETLLSPSEENCKNSNQLASFVTPLQPYQGRNPCLERNLLLDSSDSLLIDKSSKHCTSSDSQNLITNDFLNFQMLNHRATPIPYLQNAVHATPKQQNTNISSGTSSKTKQAWISFRTFFSSSEKKDKKPTFNKQHTQVKLNSKRQNGVATSVLEARPSTLPLLLGEGTKKLSKQHSLEQFHEVFSSTSDLAARLKKPAERVKTPGDVPPSVRRTRGKAAAESSARFSLYDDSIMCRGQWGSAPDLEPQNQPLKCPQLNELQDRDSVSSF